MSLNYHRNRKDCNVSRLPRSVYNNSELPQSLSWLESHEVQRVGVAPLTRRWLDGGILCHLVYVLGTHALGTIFATLYGVPTVTLKSVQYFLPRMT